MQDWRKLPEGEKRDLLCLAECMAKVPEEYAAKYRKLEAENEKMKGQIKEAINSVENGHEDDMGYNVLCSLGATC